MVKAKAMFDSALKLANIGAPISTSLHTNAMTLAITPLPSIRIPCIKPINAIAVPQSLPVLPFISTPPRPALNSVAIVFTINPLALVPPIHKKIIHPASITLPFVELPLVKVPVAVKLHAFPYYFLFFFLISLL